MGRPFLARMPRDWRALKILLQRSRRNQAQTKLLLTPTADCDIREGSWLISLPVSGHFAGNRCEVMRCAVLAAASLLRQLD